MIIDTDKINLPSAPGPSNGNVPYLIAVVVTVLLGLTGVITVMILRPTQDNAALYTIIGGFTAPTTAAILAFMQGRVTHSLVNSRMDEFKTNLKVMAAINEEVAHQAGVKQGEALGKIGGK